MKYAILLYVLIVFFSGQLIIGQEISVKGGIGFYNIYEENLLAGRERKIELNPTPTLNVALDWNIGNEFMMGIEAGVRTKTGRVDYIGLDTSSNSKAIYGQINFYDYNFDIKTALKYKFIQTSNISFTPFFSSGISIKFYDDFKAGRRNYDIVEIPPDGEMPPEIDAIINNSGVFIETGLEVKYKSVLISIQYLIEFFKNQIYNVGDIKSTIIQIKIGYKL